MFCRRDAGKSGKPTNGESRTVMSGWLRNPEADPERELARRAKAVGMLRSEYLINRIQGVHGQAKRERWPTEYLAKAIDDIEQLANEIWGQLQ
jgi:hypothetical protein